MEYSKLDKSELRRILAEQYVIYHRFKNLGLSYDMTRGKPCTQQLDLSSDMESSKYVKGFSSISDQEVRNYGVLDGIPEAKKLMAEMLGVGTNEIIVGGSSSLNLMYDMLSRFMLFGTGKGGKPWVFEEKRKFVCLVPGYDRHFLISEKLGFELIAVPLTGDGPDMDILEKTVLDPAVKGMWMIPKYSNPTGEVFSDEKIRRMASMKTGAPDFRIFCDDAYTVHFLKDAPAKQLNILTACKEAGNPDRVFLFGSTSKITFPGSGIAALCASEDNVKYALSLLTVQTICYDKINQLRHARYLKDYNGILAHMKKHADIIAPKFAAVDRILKKELGGLGILDWKIPEGGYFISVNTMPGVAMETWRLCKEAGLTLTKAGATFPYGNDPKDENLRIAPSNVKPEDVGTIARYVTLCARLAALEKILEK